MTSTIARNPSTLIIITGASKGIGRACAIAFADHYYKKEIKRNEVENKNDREKKSEVVKICLVARSKEDLSQTIQLMEHRNRIGNNDTKSNSGSKITDQTINVVDFSIDLSNLDTLEANMNKIFKELSISPLHSSRNNDENGCLNADQNTCNEQQHKRNNSSTVERDSGNVEPEFVNYRRAILINNAGSVGPLGPSTPISSTSCSLPPSLLELQKAIDLNVTSSIWISSSFIHHFGKAQNQQSILSRNGEDSTTQNAYTKNPLKNNPETINATTKCTVVNMSSLCAIEAFPTMGPYCTGKAARDMFHMVMAKEINNEDKDANGDLEENEKERETNKGDDDNCSNATSNNTPVESNDTNIQITNSSKNIKILNYAPGAIDTNMVEILGQCENLDGNLSTFFNKKEDLLKPMDTANRLVDLIMSDKFVGNGEHIDYWDLEKEIVNSSK